MQSYICFQMKYWMVLSKEKAYSKLHLWGKKPNQNKKPHALVWEKSGLQMGFSHQIQFVPCATNMKSDFLPKKFLQTFSGASYPAAALTSDF